MTRFSYSLLVVAATLMPLALFVNNAPTVVAAPVPQQLPEHGIIKLSNGDIYSINKINNAPNITIDQLTSMTSTTKSEMAPKRPLTMIESETTKSIETTKPAEDTKLAEVAPATPTSNDAPVAPITESTPVPPSKTSSVPIVTDNAANENSGKGTGGKLKNIVKEVPKKLRHTVHDNADKVGIIGGAAVGIGVTSATASVLGPVAPIAGVSKCTEDNASIACLKA
ncbi:hypothetical protein BDF19DRAFT_450705 [Syncephalis fuscata]|nr:hypothetical protein BDF19DRAFT_450705 [Syncephalis fuscata]